jgi:hypothetical protein
MALTLTCQSLSPTWERHTCTVTPSYPTHITPTWERCHGLCPPFPLLRVKQVLLSQLDNTQLGSQLITTSCCLLCLTPGEVKSRTTCFSNDPAVGRTQQSITTEQSCIKQLPQEIHTPTGTLHQMCWAVLQG